jgi:translation initiation factor IF-2
MGKPIRLGQLLGEFNLGINTVVDFLKKKGFEVESKPTSKITPEMYDILMNEFQSDKSIKEKSGKVEIKKVKKETISIEEVDEKLEEKPKKEVVVEKPVVKTEEVFKTEKLEPSGPKVIGKIDLSAGKKTAPKTEEIKEPVKVTEEKVVETVKVEPVVEVKQDPVEDVKPQSVPETKIEEPKTIVSEDVKTDLPVEDKIEEVKPKQVEPGKNLGNTYAPDEDGVTRTKIEKLTGPVVLGKIELPVDKRKEAVDNKKKRKRKRIKKENVVAGSTDASKMPPKPEGGGQGQNRPNVGGNPNPNRERKPFIQRKPEVKVELSEEEVQKQIRETLARLSGGKQKSKTSKFRRQKRDSFAQRQMEDDERSEQENKVLKVTEFISANELSSLMDVTVNEVISACMSLGLFVSINQRLDAETISIVAEEFGFDVNFVDADQQNLIEDIVDNEEDLLPRAPIVTVMGHVDHGKTSLLDKIRNTKVVDGEAGGITQHIGAYSVKLEGGKMVTFLDTPGHEAFTAMRARGAKVTDIAIIIISADDSVMPQTIEAINHAQAAGVPMVFAINKIDKPGANPDRIREQLSAMNILVEEWGGKYQCQEISAKNNINIDELLDKVLLEAEIMELKANPNRLAKATVVESSLDKGRGYVATVLVQTGTLKVGDIIVAGSYSGKVKAMFDDLGRRVKVAGPCIPVQILGLSGAPQAGDILNVMENEKDAKDIANKRLQLQREQGIRTQKHITLDEIGRRIAVGNFKELNLIIKGDVDGSIEALTDSLLKLSNEQIQVNVLHKSVGQITESDVLLASASDAIIIGFQVRPSSNARKIADQEEIEIRLYSIIYDAIEEVKDAMEGMLAPKIEEKIVANVEIREVFKITKVGTVAGCYVLDGKINRANKIRVIREGIVKYDGALGSLKRFKEDVKDVAAGYECGLNIDKFNDIRVGDIIEAYEEVEVKQKLTSR